MIQHTLYLNSNYAVKRAADGKETALPADTQGNIEVRTGDELVFKDQDGRNVGVSEIVFRTQDTPLNTVINGNARCPYTVPAESVRGISSLMVYKIKALDDCTFFYEALA